MSITLTTPQALWLLAILPVLWFSTRWGRTNFRPWQRLIQTATRSLTIALLALALAQPVMSLTGAGTSVVYLVDVSHSVASQSIHYAADRIDALNALLRPEHAAVLAFAGSAAVLPDTRALRALADATGEGPGLPGRDATDLEHALDEARAAAQPGRQPRIVLFSDGHETSGDVSAAAVRLGASGIPVFVEPLAPRDLGDTWIESLAMPDRVVAGLSVAVRARVTSQKPADASIELRDDSAVLASRRVSLAAGVNEIALDVTFDRPGTRVIHAVVTADDDPLAANDRLDREVVVEPRAHVLYVEGQPSSATYLQTALTHAGFDVQLRDGASVPSTLGQLEPWDVVILSDVARTSISDAAMTAMATWVEHQGGGLLIAGGPNVFGVSGRSGTPGYRHTELERLMPVTFERNDDPEVALVIILDRSWSMAGQVIALCKAAAQAAVDVMGDDHLVGVLTFNDSYEWTVKVTDVGPHRQDIRSAIGDIEASGYTVMYPAMEQAYDALRAVKARAKHIVLLSDGKSSPGEFESLVAKMARAGMTVSSVAVGPSADAELLANIATWGGGRSYAVVDARQLAQIFVTEAKSATMPALQEDKPIKPAVNVPAFLKGLDLRRMPPLRGRTAVATKDQALEVLSSDSHDPLLAFWPIGLGRTAVFASDVKDRWASEWVKWPGYGAFFATLVHALERPHQPVLDVVAGVSRNGIRPLAIAVEARDAMGGYRNLLKPVVKVEAGTAAAVDLPVRQVGPGRYEVRAFVDATQSVRVTLANPAGPGGESRLLVVDPAAEYRFRPPDVARLDAVAAATGGGRVSDGTAMARDTGARTGRRRALWPVLVGFALACWFVDILVRRIRLFETT